MLSLLSWHVMCAKVNRKRYFLDDSTDEIKEKGKVLAAVICLWQIRNNSLIIEETLYYDETGQIGEIMCHERIQECTHKGYDARRARGDRAAVALL